MTPAEKTRGACAQPQYRGQEWMWELPDPDVTDPGELLRRRHGNLVAACLCRGTCPVIEACRREADALGDEGHIRGGREYPLLDTGLSQICTECPAEVLGGTAHALTCSKACSAARRKRLHVLAQRRKRARERRPAAKQAAA